MTKATGESKRLLDYTGRVRTADRAGTNKATSVCNLANKVWKQPDIKDISTPLPIGPNNVHATKSVRINRVLRRRLMGNQ